MQMMKHTKRGRRKPKVVDQGGAENFVAGFHKLSPKEIAFASDFVGPERLLYFSFPFAAHQQLESLAGFFNARSLLIVPNRNPPRRITCRQRIKSRSVVKTFRDMVDINFCPVLLNRRFGDAAIGEVTVARPSPAVFRKRITRRAYTSSQFLKSLGKMRTQRAESRRTGNLPWAIWHSMNRRLTPNHVASSATFIGVVGKSSRCERFCSLVIAKTTHFFLFSWDGVR